MEIVQARLLGDQLLRLPPLRDPMYWPAVWRARSLGFHLGSNPCSKGVTWEGARPPVPAPCCLNGHIWTKGTCLGHDSTVELIF